MQLRSEAALDTAEKMQALQRAVDENQLEMSKVYERNVDSQYINRTLDQQIALRHHLKLEQRAKDAFNEAFRGDIRGKSIDFVTVDEAPKPNIDYEHALKYIAGQSFSLSNGQLKHKG